MASELLDEIYSYGYAYTAEGDCKFKPSEKSALHQDLRKKRCLNLNTKLKKSAMKLETARMAFNSFSGTEPLLRIFAEMEDKDMQNIPSKSERLPLSIGL